MSPSRYALLPLLCLYCYCCYCCYCSSQCCYYSCRNADAHERTKGAHGTNDAVENKFATADYVMRFFRGISVLNASGIVQQRTAHDFDHPLLIVSDRRKRKTAGAEPESDKRQEAGFFWSVLNDALRSSLVRASIVESSRWSVLRCIVLLRT